MNSIKIVESVSNTLTKEQKRFNRLVKEIESLRAEVAQFRALDLELTRIGTARVLPVEESVIHLERQWVMALHATPARKNLSSKLRKKFAQMMCEQIADLLDTTVLAGDAELKAVYDSYNTVSYDEQRSLDEQHEKSTLASVASQMFGLDVGASDFDDLEQLEAKVHAKMEADDAAREAGRTQKKKTAKQAKNEAKRKEVESAVNKTTRQIYLELIKYFHPDRELDENKRLEKTEIMKQITAAYEADDHLKLLELQMTLLLTREHAYANFGDQELKFFNQQLQQQVRDLEFERDSESPEYNGNMFAMLFDKNPARMHSNIERHIRAQKSRAKDIRHDLLALRNEAAFKDYVERYEFNDELEVFDDFF